MELQEGRLSQERRWSYKRGGGVRREDGATRGEVEQGEKMDLQEGRWSKERRWSCKRGGGVRREDGVTRGEVE